MNRKRQQLANQEVETFPHLQNEVALQQQGYRFIAGLDEAGRGAWAGPVIAAAVILPVGSLELETTLCGVQDSKKLTPNRRQHLFDIVTATALAVGIGSAPPSMVDEVNIIGATRYAMQQAVGNLSLRPDFLLVDHLKLPEISIPQHAFAKADSISLTVAAASIVAKVTRDRLMVEFNHEYPAYAFDRHKGYGTQLHRAALAKHGPCPQHRMSFQPLQVIDRSGA